MTPTPDSMAAELGAWNDGRGIDLESWVGCEGSFRLAVGYSTIFWPRFVEFEGYILRAGFSVDSLRRFEATCEADRRKIETVLNHLHIADIQYFGCEDLSADKALLLGNTLREIYEAKLLWQFPDRPCTVSFYVPDDPAELTAYEVSFWQTAHGRSSGDAPA